MILNTKTEFGFYPAPYAIVTNIALRDRIYFMGKMGPSGLYCNMLSINKLRTAVYPEREREKQ